MTPDQLLLWERLERFAIDEGEPANTFVARLARENGWTDRFAERVVFEYKRFLFLALTAGHPVTPSIQVDEAWHLHLTFTRSYWQRLCGEVLRSPLHHDPTRGGEAEETKFEDWYERTLESYHRIFQVKPPVDIWPPASVRFGGSPVVRVDRTHNWIAPKRSVRRAIVAFMLLAIFVGGIGLQLVSEGSMSFGIAAGEAVPILLAGSHHDRRRCAGNAATTLRAPAVGEPLLDWETSVRLLSYGRSSNGRRILAAALARLVTTGEARVSNDGSTVERTTLEPGSMTALERLIYEAFPLQKDDAVRIRQIVSDIDATVHDDSLVTKKLVHNWLDHKTVGLLSATACVAVFLVLLLPAWLRFDDAFEVFCAAMGSFAFIAVQGLAVGFVGLSRVTYRGKHCLRRLKKECGPKTWPSCGDPSRAIVTGGTDILAGTSFATLHEWFPSESKAAGSCGVSCGGGCGGCGGGGCGCGG